MNKIKVKQVAVMLAESRTSTDLMFDIQLSLLSVDSLSNTHICDFFDVRHFSQIFNGHASLRKLTLSCNLITIKL